MNPPEDYYAILQIPHSAELKAIKAAYRKLARQYHPDKNKNPDATRKMREINVAFEVLSDFERRRKYDFEWLQWERANSPYNTPTNNRDSEDDNLKQNSPISHQSKETINEDHSKTRQRPSRKTLGFIIIVVLGIVFAIIGIVFSGKEGTSHKILFESGRDSNFEIYVMNTDGEGQVNLTNNPEGDRWPVWSPDGTKIVFMSFRDGKGEIYIMNADGTGQTRLTNNEEEESFPSGLPWSPDGSKLVFTAYTGTATFGSAIGTKNEIYIINANGISQINLTNNPADDSFPSWSPDGSRIVFESDRDGNYEIYVMNADGTGQINLTNNPADDNYPLWSPDSSKIAFISDRSGNNEIYVMNADGTGQSNLTNNLADNGRFSWSPDGSRIVFESNIWSSYYNYHSEIYVMNADGTGQINLTNNMAQDQLPLWSPDGSKIAFNSGRSGDDEIYVMNADGTGQINLTNNPAIDLVCSWR